MFTYYRIYPIDGFGRTSKAIEVLRRNDEEACLDAWSWLSTTAQVEVWADDRLVGRLFDPEADWRCMADAAD